MYESRWNEPRMESHKVGLSIALFWVKFHIRSRSSVGRTLRSLAESEPKPLTENFAIKEAITAGEMVSKESLDKLLNTNILLQINKKGVIIDGFPRDMSQILEFQQKVSLVNNCCSSKPLIIHSSVLQYKQIPPIVLLDCSKLQLGRGRLDDSVSSFRRRLELFRELTLPMLKSMDTDGRLTIVSLRF